MSGRIHTFNAGHSVEGRELPVQSNRAAVSPGATLILGGVHGDEPATNVLVAEFVARQLAALARPVIAWPLVNPDGLVRGTRTNARGVDLNRNCVANWRPFGEHSPGPAPWSEPENCALRDLILQWEPVRIVTLHWALGELDADGAQSVPMLNAMWASLSAEEQCPYRTRLNVSSAALDLLPGSLGSWCGYSLQYRDGARPAIVTLELPAEPRLPREEELSPEHWQAVQEHWRRDPADYLAAVRPGVMKMLLAACELGG